MIHQVDVDVRCWLVDRLTRHRKGVSADFADRVHVKFDNTEWDQDENLVRDIKHYVQAWRFEVERIDSAIVDVLRAKSLTDSAQIVKTIVDEVA